MGHIKLSVLPNTRAWQQCLARLNAGESQELIIAAAVAALEPDLLRAMDNPALARAMHLLTLLPEAARSGAYDERLQALGLDVPGGPDFLGLLRGVGAVIDRQNDQVGRSDFGEIVHNAMVETLSASVGALLPNPLRASALDTREALAALAGSSRFPALAREFFSRLTRDSLAYYLSRTLSQQIGPGNAFASVRGRDAFDTSLDRHCRQASGMIQEFSRAWHTRVAGSGEIDTAAAQRFAAVSLKTMLAELERPGTVYA